MKPYYNSIAIILACLASTVGARAYEFGAAPASQVPGIVLGDAATAPPPGVYGFLQAGTYQGALVGPGAPVVNNHLTGVSIDLTGAGLLFVPGWTLLGATYDAVAVLPGRSDTLGAPINYSDAGVVNPFIAPIQLSWKLGESGFYVKTGLGMYVPAGTISGPAGLSEPGSPWWTFQPEIAVSYFKNGWNFTANVFTEFHTRNTYTGYRSGDILHGEFTATKTIDKWTVGPVAYYLGQVSNDTSSGFYNGAINVNRYNVWAVGGLVAYDFGPATLKVWALDQVFADASGGTAGPPGLDTASTTKGWSVYSSLSFRLWGPESNHTPSHLLVK
jgi:hypothetical protein